MGTVGATPAGRPSRRRCRWPERMEHGQRGLQLLSSSLAPQLIPRLCVVLALGRLPQGPAIRRRVHRQMRGIEFLLGPVKAWTTPCPESPCSTSTSVALEAAVAKDFPGLHTGDDGLDAGADLFVGLFSVGQLFAIAAVGASRALEIPKSGASRRSVRSVRQYAYRHPVLQRRRPRAAPADRICTFAAQGRHQLAEAGRSYVIGAVRDGSDAVITQDAARSSHLRPVATGQVCRARAR